MYRVHFNHPIFSISPGINEHEVLIVGGGGSSKTGVPNLLQFGTINSDGILKINNKTVKYPQIASCITSHSTKRKTYAVIGVGSKILLLNKRYVEINSFDTCMEKLFFRSLNISPKSNLLIAVDGDDILRLFRLPTMNQVDFTSDYNVQRATFVNNSDNIDNEENLLILCASQSKIQLRKPEKEFPIVAESEVFNLEPKQISAFDNLFYFTGVSREKKSSLVIKLKYNIELNKIETLKIFNQANTLITDMSVNSKSIILGTADGDVIFLDRFSLKKQMVSSKVHSWPISSICTVDDFTVTGGMDSVVSVIKRKETTYTKYIFIFVCILAIVIGVLIHLKNK